MRLFLLVSLIVCAAPAALAAQYHDDFEDERVGERPSHWMESEADENWKAPPPHWRVAVARDATDHAGERVFLADEAQGERKALLHTFGSNVQFEADVFVVKPSDNPKAKLKLLVRHNSDRDRIEVTYHFGEQQWEIREKTGAVKPRRDGKLINNPSRLLASTDKPLPAGWNRIEIVAVQSTVIVKLNGRELMTAVKVEHLNYGKVGVEVQYAEVMFDNFEYSGDGEGRVHDGIKEIGNMHNELYSDIFKMSNGLLTVKSHQGRWGVLQTADDGETWQASHGTPLTKRDLNQVALLDNQHVVDISARRVVAETKTTKPQYVYERTVSSDNGATWSEPVRLPRAPTHTYMEAGRLQRMPNNRLFFFIDNGRHLGTQLYISDDEGASWTVGAAMTPTTFPDVFKNRRRFEAPHAVQCGDGRIAVFFRTNRDYHYRTISDDQGSTWSDPVPVFTLRSSLSDAGYDYDPTDKSIYAVWNYELRRDPPGCKKTEGQWPRERMVLTRSTDCGATWTYLMDLDNWDGNDGRFNQMVLRVIGDYIWVSADTHTASAPRTCGGAAYATTPMGRNFDFRRLYRIDKRKLQPLPRMPLLLTR
jgi:hypothetical protein